MIAYKIPPVDKTMVGYIYKSSSISRHHALIKMMNNKTKEGIRTFNRYSLGSNTLFCATGVTDTITRPMILPINRINRNIIYPCISLI
jgi:hypothetical protein